MANLQESGKNSGCVQKMKEENEIWIMLLFGAIAGFLLAFLIFGGIP